MKHWKILSFSLLIIIGGYLLTSCISSNSESAEPLNDNTSSEEPDYQKIESFEFSNEEFLDHLDGLGFDKDELTVTPTAIEYGDIIFYKTKLAEDMANLNNILSNTSLDKTQPLLKSSFQRYKETNYNLMPRVSRRKLYFALSPKIRGHKKYSAAIRRAYKRYESMTRFTFKEASSYGWCKKNKEKCTRWFRDNNLRGGVAAKTEFPRALGMYECYPHDESGEYLWRETSRDPYIIPGETVRVNLAGIPKGWDEYNRVASHELGHTLGMAHSNENRHEVVRDTPSLTNKSVMCQKKSADDKSCPTNGKLTNGDEVALITLKYHRKSAFSKCLDAGHPKAVIPLRPYFKD